MYIDLEDLGIPLDYRRRAMTANTTSDSRWGIRSAVGDFINASYAAMIARNAAMSKGIPIITAYQGSPLNHTFIDLYQGDIAAETQIIDSMAAEMQLEITKKVKISMSCKQEKKKRFYRVFRKVFGK